MTVIVWSGWRWLFKIDSDCVELVQVAVYGRHV